MKSVSLNRGDVLTNPHGRFVSLGPITLSPRDDLSGRNGFRKLALGEHPPEASEGGGWSFPWGWILYFYFLSQL